MCTATQQKNGHGSEEEADKPEQSSAEKVLVEEKSQLEEQLKDMTVCLQTELQQLLKHSLNGGNDGLIFL